MLREAPSSLSHCVPFPEKVPVAHAAASTQAGRNQEGSEEKWLTLEFTTHEVLPRYEAINLPGTL